MSITTVLFDDCEYSDAQELLHDGAPFTGRVIETTPDGRLASEEYVREGIPDGVSRVWFHSGVLKSELYSNFGAWVARREFHRNGRRKRVVRYDGRGRTTLDVGWDHTGRPVDPHTLD